MFYFPFLRCDIILNANKLGVSLGNNGKEISKKFNDLLDLEVERAMEMIRNIAGVKPMNDADINARGMGPLESLCEDLVPTSLMPDKDNGIGSEGYMAPPQSNGCAQPENNYIDWVVGEDKPKHPWKRNVYHVSGVHRSARFKTRIFL